MFYNLGAWANVISSMTVIELVFSDNMQSTIDTYDRQPQTRGYFAYKIYYTVRSLVSGMIFTFLRFIEV